MAFDYPYGMPVHPGYFYNPQHEVAPPGVHGSVVRRSASSVTQNVNQQAGPTVGVSVNIASPSDFTVSIKLFGRYLQARCVCVC